MDILPCLQLRLSIITAKKQTMKNVWLQFHFKYLCRDDVPRFKMAAAFD